MERDRQHGPELDLNGEAQAERSGTDLGELATGITYHDGVVWDDGASVQIWAKVDVS